MKKSNPKKYRSALTLCIKKLRNQGFTVFKTEDGHYTITRGYDSNVYEFTPAEVVQHTPFFLSNMHVTGAKTRLKASEHRKARAATRDSIRKVMVAEHVEDVDIDPSRQDDIWSWD